MTNTWGVIKNAEAAIGEEIAGAGSDAVGYITDAGRHGTAWLLELHSLELTLHRHPIFHNTYGEPSDPSLSSNLTIGHGAPCLEHVGQSLALATWNTCTHAHIEITVTPHRSP